MLLMDEVQAQVHGLVMRAVAGDREALGTIADNLGQGDRLRGLEALEAMLGGGER